MKDKIILCVVCVISVVALSITYNSKQTLQKENMKLKEEIGTIENEKLEVEKDYRTLLDGFNDLNEAYSKLKVEYDNLPK
jgi:chromosome segregation ATPase